MVPLRHERLDLAGYMPSIPTPFDDAGTLDCAAFERLCERQIKVGATALVVAATTGEASTLSAGEYRVLVHLGVRVANGRVPVIAGVVTNSTAHAIELAHDAERLGADALLCVVPYYNRPSQPGMIAHFTAIARETNLPIILHDAPARCGCGLTDDTIGELAESPQFIGLEDDTGDVARPGRLRAKVGYRFQLLSGHDMTAFAFMALGGDGCISQTVNVMPELCRDMYLAFKDGHIDQAQRLAVSVAHMSAALAQAADPVSLKYALSLLGLVSPSLRLPLVELEAHQKAQVADVIQQIKNACPGHMESEPTAFIPAFCRNAMSIGYL